METSERIFRSLGIFLVTIVLHLACFGWVLPNIAVLYLSKAGFSPDVEWAAILIVIASSPLLATQIIKGFKVVKENHTLVTINDLFGGTFQNYPQGLNFGWWWEKPVEEVPMQDSVCDFSGNLKTTQGNITVTGGTIPWRTRKSLMHVFRKAGKDTAERKSNIEKQIKAWIFRIIELAVGTKSLDEVIAQKDNFIQAALKTAINGKDDLDETLGIDIGSIQIGNLEQPESVAAVQAGSAEHTRIMKILKSIKTAQPGLADRDALLYAMSITGNGANAHLISGNGGGNGKKGKGGGRTAIIVDGDGSAS